MPPPSKSKPKAPGQSTPVPPPVEAGKSLPAKAAKVPAGGKKFAANTDPKPSKKPKKVNRPAPDADQQNDPGNGLETDPKNFTESADSAQPLAEIGVDEDMATAAFNPGMGPGIPSGIEASYDFDAAAIGSGVLPGIATEVTTLPPEAASWANTDWAKLTDAEIMLRVSAGEEAGFDLLLAKYRRPIVHYMFRMVHNQAIAEELAQEVFLRVYRSRQTYRAEARFSTWLYRIATNLGVNYARDHKQERAANNVYLDEQDEETGTTPDVSDGSLSAEQQLLRQERMDAIRSHVMALPERQRNAVLMHKYQDMDYKQIGEVLQLSESATKSLLFRAYQTLRDRLKDYL